MELNSSWSPRPAEKIGGILLDETYRQTMATMLSNIHEFNGGVFGIEGATNGLSKSISNVILHTPKHFLLDI